MTKEQIRKHIIFHGRVQGVGFRYYAVNKARALGASGWVKNLYDGTVEMEIQGTELQIEELILFLQNQRFIDIEHVDSKRIPIKDDSDFRERW
ncbi:MAG: acylphosphatase [Hespellia sp.]|nr:acylphosphatase [Hespellia sp.]